MRAQPANPAGTWPRGVVLEEHEVKVLPCLARNAPIASLIDLLYLEEHSNAYRLQATYARLRAHGVVVETGWP